MTIHNYFPLFWVILIPGSNIKLYFKTRIKWHFKGKFLQNPKKRKKLFFLRTLTILCEIWKVFKNISFILNTVVLRRKN